MNTHRNAPDTAVAHAFQRAEFRLTYVDLYETSGGKRKNRDIPLIATVEATEEFPLFADIVCLFLLGSAAEESLHHMGGRLETSNVSFQGWIERYSRKAGVTGWTPPTGMFALFRFRVRVLGRIFSLIHHESLRKS